MLIKKPSQVNRRTTLTGLGVTLGLPWLEVMADNKAAQKPSPKRMAFVFVPNGINADFWTPKKEGADYDLPKTLSPLGDLKKDVLVLTNLRNKNSKGGDGHYAKVANLLSGTPITKTTGRGMSCGITVDQLAAQKFGSQTPLPSLELSIQEPSTSVDNNVGYTALYGGYISWSGATSPVARETYPRLAFDRLFNRRSHAAESKSLLDLVMNDIQALKKKIGKEDQHKIEEYLTSVRALENRISFSEKNSKPIDPEWVKQNRPMMGKPSSVEEHQSLMYDIMAMAFQSDRTRICSYMLGRAVSGLNYSFLGGGITSNHHSISHHAGDEDKKRQYQMINEYHIKAFSKFIAKLKNMKEGHESVLDHSMILYASGQRDGNSHNPENLPILLAGGSKLGLNTGRHLMYKKDTPLCELYVGMLNRYGVKTQTFGDATKELPNLS